MTATLRMRVSFPIAYEFYYRERRPGVNPSTTVWRRAGRFRDELQFRMQAAGQFLRRLLPSY